MPYSPHSNWFVFAFTDSAESGTKTPRRRSFYNFFLRHQDAVDDSATSPSVNRKQMSSGGGSTQNLSQTTEKHMQLQTVPKQRRATSFVRKKPPFERGLSAQSALRINKNALVGKWWNVDP